MNNENNTVINPTTNNGNADMLVHLTLDHENPLTNLTPQPFT